MKNCIEGSALEKTTQLLPLRATHLYQDLLVKYPRGMPFLLPETQDSLLSIWPQTQLITLKNL